MPGPGAIKAGNAFILIEAVDKASNVFDVIGLNLTRMGRQIESVGRSMLMIGVAAAFPIGLAIGKFADLDSALLELRAKSAGTVGEFETLAASAEKVGQETSVTATRVAELMAILAGSGYNRKQIQGIFADLVDLTIGSGRRNPFAHQHAAQLLSGIVRSRRIDLNDTETMKKIIDLIAVASNTANFHLEDMAITMQYINNEAAAANVPLEEMFAIITLMRQSGTEASTIGTGFRSTIANLTEPARMAKVNAVLQEYAGVMIEVRNAEGGLRNVSDVLFSIGDAIKDLGSAQQLEVIRILFGKTAFGAGLNLTKGQNPFSQLMGLMQGANGKAQQMRKTMESGLMGALDRMAGAVEALGNAFAKVLKPLILFLADVVEKYIGAAIKWIETNPGFVTAVVSAVSAVVALGGVFLVIGTALKLMGVAFTAFAWAGVALMFFYNRLDKTRMLLTSTFTPAKIKAFFTAVIGFITGLPQRLKAVWTWIVGIGSSIAGMASSFLMFLLTVGITPEAFAALVAIIAIAIATFVSFQRLVQLGLAQIIGAFNAFFGSMFQGFVKLGENAGRGLNAAFDALASGDIETAWQVMLATLTYSWLQFQDSLIRSVNTLHIALNGFIMAFKYTWKGVFDMMEGFVPRPDDILAAQREWRGLFDRIYETDFFEGDVKRREALDLAKKELDLAIELAEVRAKERKDKAAADRNRMENMMPPPAVRPPSSDILVPAGRGTSSLNVLEPAFRGTAEALKKAAENNKVQEKLLKEIKDATIDTAYNTGRIADNLEMA